MNRNVVLRLLDVIAIKSKKDYEVRDRSIRAIFGMCQEHIVWKANFYFKERRKELSYVNICLWLRPNPKGECELSRIGLFERCLFTSKGHRSIFLNKEISEGVFRWTLKIEYNDLEDCTLRIGTVPANLLSESDNFPIGLLKGTCCFWLYHSKFSFRPLGFSNYTHYQCGLDGVENERLIRENYTVNDNDVVAVEIDIAAHSMFFFYSNGETSVLFAISHIPSPLYLGVSALHRPSFTSMSFRRLPCITRPTETFVFYKCRV